MEKALSFNAVEFATITRNNQPWLRLPQIEGALGYTTKGKAIQTLYTRHADEFTDEMTAVVKLPTEGGEQDVRIFSLRGCHLLAMFARTPVAKAFRKWVLDVLDRLDRERQTEQPAPQAVEPDDAVLQWLLAKEIRRAAEEGRPFTRFGKVSGLHARRGEMDIPLRVLGWKKLQKLFAGLQERGLVTVGEYSRSGGRHLDARVPQRPKPALPPLAARPAPAPKAVSGPTMPVPVDAPKILRTLHNARQVCRFDFLPQAFKANDREAAERHRLAEDLYKLQDCLWAALYNVCSAAAKLRA